MADESEGVADYKRSVDAGFDEALAEISAALDAVPWPAAVPLPGLEPAVYRDPYGDELGAPEAPVVDNPWQGRFDFSAERSEEEDAGDPITEFAPSPRIDWGPRLPRLKRDGDETDDTPDS